MPFELGLCLGFHHGLKLGSKSDTRKQQHVCIIFDEKPHRYLAYLSDLRGRDTVTHDRKPERIIAGLRNWFETLDPNVDFPSGKHISNEFKSFLANKNRLCKKMNLDPKDLSFPGRCKLILKWLENLRNTRVIS